MGIMQGFDITHEQAQLEDRDQDELNSRACMTERRKVVKDFSFSQN